MRATLPQGTTVTEYLKGLPTEKRAVLSKVRSVVRKHMPKGYKETFSSGMMIWVVPLSVYPDTYNGHPLWYVGLAAQKNYYVLHLMGVYGNRQVRSEFEKAYKASGHRLDMGQACVRFKAVDDLPLDVIGHTVARVPLEAYVRWVDEATKNRKTRRK